MPSLTTGNTTGDVGRERGIHGLFEAGVAMIESDDEFWVHWFIEQATQLHTRSAVRVSSEQDALTCLVKIPSGVVGRVAVRVTRDRADGTYGPVTVLGMQGDVPGDFMTRLEAALPN